MRNYRVINLCSNLKGFEYLFTWLDSHMSFLWLHSVRNAFVLSCTIVTWNLKEIAQKCNLDFVGGSISTSNRQMHLVLEIFFAKFTFFRIHLFLFFIFNLILVQSFHRLFLVTNLRWEILEDTRCVLLSQEDLFYAHELWNQTLDHHTCLRTSSLLSHESIHCWLSHIFVFFNK